MQSHTEVLDFLSRNPPPTSSEHSIPVLSISPQSLASLAASISPSAGSSVSLSRVLARIRVFCQQVLGIQYVFDTTFARHVSLSEHLKEFRERKSSNELPMLASACPGWVCYAEKAHGEMIPFMSQTKSPQQVMGTIVQLWIGSKCLKTFVRSNALIRLPFSVDLRDTRSLALIKCTMSRLCHVTTRNSKHLEKIFTTSNTPREM